MRLRAAGTIAVLTLLSPIAATAPSQADPGNPFDITLTGSNVSVKGESCMEVPITVRHTGPRHEYFDINVDMQVWKGNDSLGSATAYTGEQTGSMPSYYYWCSYEGLGQMRVGPSTVDWDDYRGDSTITGSFRDTSQAVLTVRQWSTSKVRSVKASKKKGKRYLTITGKYRFYSIDKSGIRAASGVPMTLQRTYGKSWKSIRTVRTDSRGLVTTKIRKKRAASYRWVTASTWATWASTSKAVRR